MDPKVDIEKEIQNFAKFLKNRTGEEFVVQAFSGQEDNKVISSHEELDKAFDDLKPVAFDVLMDAEKKFFDALRELEKKHASLATIDDIKKLTSDIKKLCKKQTLIS